MENVPEALRLELANAVAKIEAENFMVYYQSGERLVLDVGGEGVVLVVVVVCDVDVRVLAVVWWKKSELRFAIDVRQSWSVGR